MNREIHVRLCERLGAKFPGPTRQIMRLLEDPSLLQAELDRRLHAAQTTDPLKRREDALRRDQARLTKSMERLLTGYQENLITLEELRCRMPDLRKQQRANEAELQSLEMTAVDPTRNLRLVETLAQFRTRLRARGNVLEVTERQRVLRLLVQEILVGGDNITIRHSIPMPTSSSDPNHGVRPSHEPPEPHSGPNYLLRSHGQHARYNVTMCRNSVWHEIQLPRRELVAREHRVRRRQSLHSVIGITCSKDFGNLDSDHAPFRSYCVRDHNAALECRALVGVHDSGQSDDGAGARMLQAHGRDVRFGEHAAVALLLQDRSSTGHRHSCDEQPSVWFCVTNRCVPPRSKSTTELGLVSPKHSPPSANRIPA